jgi:proteasome assembly chaperone 2
MEFVRPGGDGHLRNASTLLLPAVSIGNAGQLAVDLLVSTLGVRRAGFLEEPHVLPCVGNDPFGPSAEGKLTVALEVYEYEDQGLSIVQQRAPVVKGAMMKYAKNMAAWAACEGIKEVIVLSGLDSGKRQRHDMDLSQIQYISTASKDGSDGRCEALGWKRLEQYLPLSEAWQFLDRDSVTDSVVDNELSPDIHLTDDAYFPGLPFASIFSSCKAEGLKVVCVLCFCAEGDNVPDAFLIADAVQQYLHHGKPEASGMVFPSHFPHQNDGLPIGKSLGYLCIHGLGYDQWIPS